MSLGFFFFFLQDVGEDEGGVAVGRSMVGVVLGELSWAQREDESMAGWEDRASSFSASDAKHIYKSINIPTSVHVIWTEQTSYTSKNQQLH